MLIIIKKNLILVKSLTDGLDDTTIRAEDDHSINFTDSKKDILFKYALQWKYVNGVKIYQFNTKDQEIKL